MLAPAPPAPVPAPVPAQAAPAPAPPAPAPAPAPAVRERPGSAFARSQSKVRALSPSPLLSSINPLAFIHYAVQLSIELTSLCKIQTYSFIVMLKIQASESGTQQGPEGILHNIFPRDG